MKTASARAKSSLRNQLRDTARAAILDAAEELIARHGLHGAPLAQIARRAGVAVGTLYNYFADRDALVTSLFESRRATLQPMIRAATHANPRLRFEPRLRAFVREVLGAFEAHRRFVKLAIEGEHQRPSAGTTSADVRKAVETLVAIGVREHALPPERAELLSTLLAGGLRALVLRRIDEDAPLAADADELVTILLDGARR